MKFAITRQEVLDRSERCEAALFIDRDTFLLNDKINASLETVKNG